MNFQTPDPIAVLLHAEATTFSWISIAVRILLSVLIAATIGCERSSKRHAAGLRAFIFVSLAATLAVMMDIYLGLAYNNATLSFMISGAAIIGIAIISVNSTLFSSRSQIKGLTTSFGLWACGLLGISIGAGFYTVALIAYATYMCCLSLLPAFESYLKDRSNHYEVHLELKNACHLQSFVTTIRELGMKIDDIELNPAYVNSGLSVYSISISISSQELKKYKTHTDIIEALSTLDYVYHIEQM